MIFTVITENSQSFVKNCIFFADLYLVPCSLLIWIEYVEYLIAAVESAVADRFDSLRESNVFQLHTAESVSRKLFAVCYVEFL